MAKNNIKAYAVFEGGGIKGIALAGAYDAAEKQGTEFLGHAGASVGSIVAFLANIGFSGNEIKQQIITDFPKFFDWKLKKLLQYWKEQNLIFIAFLFYAFYRILRYKGIYDGKGIIDCLNKVAATKLQLQPGFSFVQLHEKTGKPLKIIATDVLQKRPVFYSHEETPDVCVISAILASCSYPFVFQPNEISINQKNTIQVDGGISSNMPSFMFYNEVKTNHRTIFCFDLTTKENSPDKKYKHGVFKHLFSIIDSAIEADSHITRRMIPNIHTIEVEVPDSVGTFTLDIKQENIEALFNSGCKCAHDYYIKLREAQDIPPKEKAELITANLAPLSTFENISLQIKSALINALGGSKDYDPLDVWIYIPTIYSTFLTIASTEDEWKEINDSSSLLSRCWHSLEAEYELSRQKNSIKKMAMPVAIHENKKAIIFVKFKEPIQPELLFETKDKRLKGSVKAEMAPHIFLLYFLASGISSDTQKYKGELAEINSL